MNINKIVIIGSGTMGSGIAAQVANAGISISLLDLPSAEGSRNQIVEEAKERILKSRPPLLIEKNKIDLIRAGNIEDDFNLIEDADWVVVWLREAHVGMPVVLAPSAHGRGRGL